VIAGPWSLAAAPAAAAAAAAAAELLGVSFLTCATVCCSSWDASMICRTRDSAPMSSVLPHAAGKPYNVRLCLSETALLGVFVYFLSEKSRKSSKILFCQ